MHCELVVFCIFRYPPQIRSGSQNGGNSPAKIWLRYNIFRKSTLLWALQNLIFRKDTARVFMRVNLAGFIRCFRLSVWQRPQVYHQIQLFNLFRYHAGKIFQTAVCRKFPISGYRFVVGAEGQSEWNWYYCSEIGEKSSCGGRSEAAKEKLQTGTAGWESGTFKEKAIAEVSDWDGLFVVGRYVVTGYLLFSYFYFSIIYHCNILYSRLLSLISDDFLQIR